MSLQPGQNLSNYRLVEQIGEGGMGVVWKAVDTTLGREVAIKVLPDIFAFDADRLSRFEREAKLLATFNHPAIATIHGFHEVSGVRFLAMELAPGVSLARRLEAGQLPLDEALAIALQVGTALEAAHESGIVHRDLKPGNIQVGPDGAVKVLDFGLAKALEGDPSSPLSSLSPTLTTPATLAGVILGTAAYMSPEQAKGKPVDRRADIWAFGCVLYEMLTGKRPFTGDGASEMLAAVMLTAVDMERLPGSVPPSIQKLVRRCLEKDPRRRLRDIGEARIVIEETLAGTADQVTSATGAGPVVIERRRLPILAIAAGMSLAVAAGAALMTLFTPKPAVAPIRRFEIASTGPFRSGIQGALLAISPDGTRVASVEAGKLTIRRLDRLDPKEVVTAGEPGFVFWSPDSTWLGYAAAGKLWKAPADGGEGTIIADRPGEMTGGSGASWGPDGRVVLGRGEPGLWEMPARGGDLKQIFEADPNVESDFHGPSWLPDGSGILFVAHAVNGRPDRLCLLAGKTRKELLRLPEEDIWFPQYSSTGHIIYRRQPANAGIWAVPFSLSKHEVTGEPFPLVPGGDVPSVADDGTLIYSRGATTRETQLVWVDRTGKVLSKIGQPMDGWPFPALSPDEKHVAIAVAEQENREVWVHDLVRGTRSRLTFGAQANYASPFWYPAGDRILFDAGTNYPFSTRVKPADGSGEGLEVGKGWGSSLSPDGRYLVNALQDQTSSTDIWVRDLTSKAEPVALVKTTRTELWPRVSPDGKYIAYSSDETGQTEIYLKRFPAGDGRWQVSATGGFWAHWSRRGDRLYFANGDKLMEVTVSTAGASPELGNPQEIFTRQPLGQALILNWPPGFDVSADGQRFLINMAAAQSQETRGYVLVQNWAAELGQ